mmetsp:Transcript_19078/g.31117  ORF Transcript_19078/g.31117 Transcript_19078/m.31117 type:complete len:235 (-) Transcript_19078:499-1203(-)
MKMYSWRRPAGMLGVDPLSDSSLSLLSPSSSSSLLPLSCAAPFSSLSPLVIFFFFFFGCFPSSQLPSSLTTTFCNGSLPTPAPAISSKLDSDRVMVALKRSVLHTFLLTRFVPSLSLAMVVVLCNKISATSLSNPLLAHNNRSASSNTTNFTFLKFGLYNPPPPPPPSLQSSAHRPGVATTKLGCLLNSKFCVVTSSPPIINAQVILYPLPFPKANICCWICLANSRVGVSISA